MKNISYTILCAALLLLFTIQTAKAQCPGCLVNASCTVTPASPAVCPDTMPEGTALQAYSEDISFYLPAQFVDDGSGMNVTLNQLTIMSVTGLPYGLSWQTNAVNNIYFPSDNPPATEHGCARICGTPLMAGTYQVTVFVQAEVSVAGIGQTVDDSFILPFTILPGSSSNSGFTIQNPLGCEPHTTSFTNLMLSGGNPGFSYSWNFGNGNLSSLENPPTQNFVNAGNYAVTLQTTVDTIGYFLSGVSVLAATGCNDSPFSAPDYYFILKQGTTTLYSSAYIDNTDPPVSFSFAPIALSNATYTMEIWEYDTGMAGGDDACGSVTFNGHAAGTQTLTSGSLISTVTVDHPVIIQSATDTVHVYATPVVSTVTVSPNDSVCQGDTVQLSITASGAASYQWYNDTVAVLNAIGPVYQAARSGLYFCEAMSPFGCRANSAARGVSIITNPPKPGFWIIGNVLNTNLAGYDLQWYFENNPVTPGNGMTCQVSATGLYHLVAANEFGCFTSSDTIYVTYNDAGFAESALQSSLQVFPNPNKGVFTVKMDLTEACDVSVMVSNILGQVLYTAEYGNESGAFRKEIELPAVVSGMYYLNVKAGKAAVHRKIQIY